jgi:predicted nucleotidyltransferase
MTKEQKTLKNHRREVLLAAERHGAARILICGSVARGDAKADSDYDFVVQMRPGRSLMDLGGLQMDLEEILGKDVDILTDGSLHGVMRKTVLLGAHEV